MIEQLVIDFKNTAKRVPGWWADLDGRDPWVWILCIEECLASRASESNPFHLEMPMASNPDGIWVYRLGESVSNGSTRLEAAMKALIACYGGSQ